HPLDGSLERDRAAIDRKLDRGALARDDVDERAELDLESVVGLFRTPLRRQAVLARREVVKREATVRIARRASVDLEGGVALPARFRSPRDLDLDARERPFGPEHDAFEDLPARERHEEQPLRDRVARAVVGREVEALSAFGANEDVERLRLVEGEATVAIRERVPRPKHLPKWIPISGDDARRVLARACLHADALERRTAFPIDDDAFEDASALERE